MSIFLYPGATAPLIIAPCYGRHVGGSPELGHTYCENKESCQKNNRFLKIDLGSPPKVPSPPRARGGQQTPWVSAKD